MIGLAERSPPEPVFGMTVQVMALPGIGVRLAPERPPRVERNTHVALAAGPHRRERATWASHSMVKPSMVRGRRSVGNGDAMDQLSVILKNLDSSSASNSKYEPLRRWLGGRLGLQPSQIRCKWLGADKNIGNRLGEVAGAPIRLLFLVASPTTDGLSIAHKAAARTRPFGTVSSAVLCVLDERKNIKTGFVISSDPAQSDVLSKQFPTFKLVTPKGEVPTRSLPLPPLPAGAFVVPPLLVEDASLSSPSSNKLRGLTEWIAATLAVRADRIATKVVGDLKNAGNRLSEAIRRGPDIVVLLVRSNDFANRIVPIIRRYLRTMTSPPAIALVLRQPDGSWIMRALRAPELLEPQLTIAGNVKEGRMSSRSTFDEHVNVVAERGPKVNAHVTRMRRHLPLGANSRELYEEHRTGGEFEKQSISTRSRQFVTKLAERPDVHLILLTGDAGHGKTHLLRRLLMEACGHSGEEALSALKSDVHGETRYERSGGRPLRLVKDLSEIEPISAAADLLAGLVDDTSAVSLVCANEGRLRAAVDLLPERLSVVRAALDATIHSGVTSAGGGVHVVNLNYQSLAARRESSFFGELLQKWVHDGRSWVVCKACDAYERCPIVSRRKYLSEDGPHGQVPAIRLIELVRAVEQTGYVLTIREALMLLAYVLTGGNNCNDVHNGDTAPQDPVASIGRLLFDRSELAPHERDRLRIIQRFARMDPGLVAIRKVDDLLLLQLDRNTTTVGVAAELSREPARSRREQKEEQREIRERLRTARRSDFFEAPADTVPYWERLGFRWFSEFQMLCDNTAIEQSRLISIRNRLMQGLHVVQGIRPKRESDLFIVDPAFARSRASTSVIAALIQARAVTLSSLSREWVKRRQEQEISVAESVDWLERKVVLRVGDSADEALELDLRQFEFIARAAEGIAFRYFHGADVRRVSSRLALALQRREMSEERITVMDAGAPKTVSIDVDDSILVGDL